MDVPAHEEAEFRAHAPRARKVLVAEDSAITLDLLKLLLSSRGHEVDVVTDGVQALEALRKKQYDVALLDYHLPNLDGLKVAVAIKAEAKGGRVPRLIAITADPEGLLAAEESCEHFDYILPKPLDIEQVATLVDEPWEFADRESIPVEASPEAHDLEAQTASIQSVLEGMGRTFLEWPEDINASRFTSRAMLATLGDTRFDALVIKVPASSDELVTLWERKALFALPVIDLTGSLGDRADFDASKLELHEQDQVDRLIRLFHERRSRLHRDVLLSDDLEDRVLGRIFVSGKPLTARLDPGSTSCVAYNVTLRADVLAREADVLCNKALLNRDFVERFHVCGRCGSSRLHARDTCTKCRSPNLRAEEYLRHFRCGFQASKSEFSDGLHLVCPKCRRQLGEIGKDYEPVATMIVCQGCGNADSKADVGMVCLDCNAHYDWGMCHARDFYSYRLTDQGTGFAEDGRSFLGLFQKPLRFEELPRELMVALNEGAKKFNEERTPFTLVNIFYKNKRAITSEHGSRVFAETRDQFLANLRTSLSGSDLVCKGASSYDFAFMPRVAPKQAAKSFTSLRQDAVSTLRFDLGATLKAFGPEDF